ncbi:hypothetical protein CK203_117816 [Vitis vinifera]|uniref:Integrase catalytic domain-containing protein n=1 Tax=Vitis vinifera TaxID=29760 RepID=A0A438CQ35_VITVI|nr:hypothetical protein CK203_117816 [Vitis vinifera]
MEADCYRFIQRCPECQMHDDLLYMPHSELHALTSPWPFSVWGIDIIGKISPKSSNGHEYILVATDYFTKWVEAASYTRLTAAKISETEWAQSRYDQLSLLDERRLRVADHVQAYQRKMTRALRKRVKRRKFQKGDLVLKVLRGLISPRGKFKRAGAGRMLSSLT